MAGKDRERMRKYRMASRVELCIFAAVAALGSLGGGEMLDSPRLLLAICLLLWGGLRLYCGAVPPAPQKQAGRSGVIFQRILGTSLLHLWDFFRAYGCMHIALPDVKGSLSGARDKAGAPECCAGNRTGLLARLLGRRPIFSAASVTVWPADGSYRQNRGEG